MRPRGITSQGGIVHYKSAAFFFIRDGTSCNSVNFPKISKHKILPVHIMIYIYFVATFSLVTRVGLLQVLESQISSLAFNNCFRYKNVL